MSAVVDEAGEASARSGPGGPDADRIEALEHQVRQLTSRLAGWVEAQLVQALDDRRDDMKALRSELQTVLTEELAGMRAEASSILSVATRRLEVAHEQLSERLDAVAARSADAAASALAGTGQSLADAERLAILEEFVGARLAGVRDQLNGDLEALRAELAGMSRGTAGGDGLEQRVRSAMSRLSDSVESRLAEMDTARRAEFDALRAELRTLAAERATAHEVAEDRLAAVSGALGRRLDEVAGAAGAAADGVAVARAEVEHVPVRMQEFEQRVKAAMSRLTESVEARLAETTTARDAASEAARAELASRVDVLGRDADRTAIALAAIQASVAQGAERAAELDQRLDTAVERLEGQLDARLAELASARTDDEARLRAESAAAASALATRVDELVLRLVGLADEVTALQREAQAGASRIDEIEQRIRAAVLRLAETVEARLAQAAHTQSAEAEAAATNLRDALAAHVIELRSELDAASAGMRARFGHVHERLDTAERLHRDAADTAGALVDAKLAEVVERRRAEFEQLEASVTAQVLETMQETLTSDGRRIEALEVHTRRTDARLAELVEAKVAELAGGPVAEVAGMRAAVDGLRTHLHAALDAHLGVTRAEVARALDDSRAELVGRARDLGVAAVAAVEAVEARSAEAAAAGAALDERLTQAQHASQARLDAMAKQVDVLVRAASVEGGVLAPVRSDVRHLQAEVAELTELVAALRPKRPAPAKKAPAPAKKAPAPRRRPQ